MTENNPPVYILEDVDIDFDIVKIRPEGGVIRFDIRDGDKMFTVTFNREHVRRISEDELMLELKGIVERRRQVAVDQELDGKINRFINKFKEKRAKTKNKER